MAPPQLSSGSIHSLLDGSLNPNHNPPVLQVIRVIKLQRGAERPAWDPDRYKLILSDGTSYARALLVVQLNHLVDSGELVDGGHAIVKMADYMSNMIRGKPVVIALKLDVLDPQHGHMIGNPTDALRGTGSSGGSEEEGRDDDDVEDGRDDDKEEDRDDDKEEDTESANGVTDDVDDDATVGYEFPDHFDELVPPSASAAAGTSIANPGMQALGNSICDEFKCPITHELLIDPVTAADGVLYERDAIEEYFEYLQRDGEILEIKSPKTNLPMKSLHLMDAPAIRNAISHVIDCGSFGVDVVDWYDQMTEVADAKKKARDHDVESMERLAQWYTDGSHGLKSCEAKARYWSHKAAKCNLERRAHGAKDAEAMCELGSGYSDGSMGLPKDATLAFRWFKMAADLADPTGMAGAGDLLVRGVGVERNKARGATLIAASAALRSADGCYFLGKLYFDGLHGVYGMHQSFERAGAWLETATKINEQVEGSLSQERVGRAETMLELCRMGRAWSPRSLVTVPIPPE